MPRLHGVRETHRLNVYDAFAIAKVPPQYEGATGDPIYQRPVSLSHVSGHLRLFGNANIGIDHLTNLQVPGFLASDQTCPLEHWYARTDILPESLTERQRASLHRFTSTTTVTLILGDKPCWRWPLSELLDERPWEPASVTEAENTPEVWQAIQDRVARRAAEGFRPLIVPVRQNVSVTIDAFQGQLHKLVEDLDGIPVMMWIHLEGIQTRDVG